jgi:hypothetical protein
LTGIGPSTIIRRDIVPNHDSTLRGRLKALTIADLLVFLHGLGRAGRLVLARGGEEAMLDLRGPYLVRAAGNRDADRLEQVLLARGRITPDQHAAALKRQEEDPGAGMGRGLIAAGVLTPRELIEARRDQARLIVQGLFEWEDGDYRFEEGHSVSGWSTPVDLPILELVADGIRSVARGELFRERLPSPDWAFEPIPGGHGLPLQPHESHLLGLLDGTRTLDALVAAGEYPADEVRRVVFLLLTLGRVKPRPMAPAEDGGEPTATLLRRFNGLFGRVFQYLTLELGPISETLLSATLRELEPAHAPLFSAARLGGDGTLDEEVLDRNLLGVARRDRRRTLVEGLSELLYRELLVLRQSLGPDHERRVLNLLRRDGLLAPGALSGALTGAA